MSMLLIDYHWNTHRDLTMELGRGQGTWRVIEWDGDGYKMGDSGTRHFEFMCMLGALTLYNAKMMARWDKELPMPIGDEPSSGGAGAGIEENIICYSRSRGSMETF
ncbi:hypothetical protein BT96DRAFT_1008424 [Gymnopus androsaceus JB14]|uniref:Uncharacterized protein n=1 Tax=Gymnopus androsaceus JB14 TaxID=1447944 RepID=A0A6A4GFB7_9AGAR|nr:hypothetical protein BT96DRAFT_1008424 [Gymnopus androsaceus JB14]